MNPIQLTKNLPPLVRQLATAQKLGVQQKTLVGTFIKDQWQTATELVKKVPNSYIPYSNLALGSAFFNQADIEKMFPSLREAQKEASHLVIGKNDLDFGIKYRPPNDYSDDTVDDLGRHELGQFDSSFCIDPVNFCENFEKLIRNYPNIAALSIEGIKRLTTFLNWPDERLQECIIRLRVYRPQWPAMQIDTHWDRDPALHLPIIWHNVNSTTEFARTPNAKPLISGTNLVSVTDDGLGHSVDIQKTSEKKTLEYVRVMLNAMVTGK